ncbi:olfactory receptor 2AT4-like [Gadus chalcogrammus]|uniref:olfactory receptor 2AT4-like n=1 Tax=Gadus chalcogrammus TaxID=1042646 RepID=UPI0024C4E3F7|nr:olfactory receptor 2AT4-like [Gadus chalcogrammus]
MNQSFLYTALSLTAYSPPGLLNYVFFVLCLLLYVLTLCANVLLIALILSDPNLHKPMYTFLLHLALNGIVGSCAVCPKVMQSLLSRDPFMSYGGCLLQVLFVNVYTLCAYAILAVMAYDRYISICKPLQYHTIITPGRVRGLLAAAYLFPVGLTAVQVYLTSQLPLCRFAVNKMFCDNLVVVKLACFRRDLDNVYGLFIVCSLVLFPFVCVLLSYMQILSISWRASKASQRKALSTCAPHLIIFINFSTIIFYSVLYNRRDSVSVLGNFLNSTLFALLPPLFHPLVYGLRTKEIQRSIQKLLLAAPPRPGPALPHLRVVPVDRSPHPASRRLGS